MSANNLVTAGEDVLGDIAVDAPGTRDMLKHLLAAERPVAGAAGRDVEHEMRVLHVRRQHGAVVVKAVRRLVVGMLGGLGDVDQTGKFIAGTFPQGPLPEEPSEFGGGEFALGTINLLLGLGAQITGNPLTPGQHYSMPRDQAKNDVFEAPNYWSHVIWHYQWGCWGVDLLTLAGTSLAKGAHATDGKLSLAGDILAGFNGVRGIVPRRCGTPRSSCCAPRPKSSAR